MKVEDSAPSVDREQLRARLREIAPPLAEVYGGAVAALAQPGFPARAHFLAHAAREIANGLPEWTSGVAGSPREADRLAQLASKWATTFQESPVAGEAPGASPSPAGVVIPRDIFEEMSRILADRSARSSSRDSTIRFFNWLGPGNRYLPADLTRFVREWMELRRWFEANAHARRSPQQAVPDDSEAVAYFERFERWLNSLLGGFFANQRELDAKLESTPPERLTELSPLLVPDQQRRHFFGRLAEKQDPKWLEALRAAGFFDNPPAQVVRDPDSHTETHAAWPAAPYLLRMAAVPAGQATVATIVEDIVSRHEIQNRLLQRDLVDIALALPASLSARASRGMRHWGRDFSDQLAERLGMLAVNLARAGETDDALALLRELLTASQPPAEGEWLRHAEPRIGRWGLATVVQKILPDFIGVTQLAGLKLVCGALDAVLRSERGRDAEPGEDHSHIWRPYVEDEKIEQGPAREVLACAVFRAANALAKDRTKVADVIELLDSERWGYFRRVSQFLLLADPTSIPGAVEKHLLDWSEWESFDREYRMLLAAGFPRLSDDGQTQILDWVDAGPDRDRARQSLAFWNGKEPTSEELDERIRRWRWLRLGPIAADLPPDWRARHVALVAEFGSPPPPEEAEVRMSGGTVPRANALTPSELQSLTVAEIAERLRAYRHPASEGPLVPDDGTSVQEAVAQSPQRFASEATRFEGLRPAYVRALLSGLERAARNRSQFDWAPVLRLASWMVAQQPVERAGGDPWGEEKTWEWTRSALARLLHMGLGQSETAPSLTLRQQVWSLIEALAADPPPNRAEAAAAAVSYAAWVASGETDVLEAAPEARRFLEQQLERDDPQGQVHARLGELLTFLAYRAPAWTRQNLDRLLPPGEHLWTAAWGAHVRGQAPPRQAFIVLAAAYRRAIEQLKPVEPDRLLGVRAEGRLQQESLAEHVALLYTRGDLDATGHEGLLDQFFRRADPSLRRHAHWALAHLVRSSDEDGADGPELEVPPEVLLRLTTLWERRVRKLEQDPSVRAELPAFGWWFSTGRFDDEWALDALENVLKSARTGSDEPVQDEPGTMRRLAHLADRYPLRAARILQRIVELTQESVGAYGWLDEARTVIHAAIRSGDAEARTAIIAVLDRLGALGFRDVGELVGPSDDLDDPLAIPYFLWDQPLTVAQFRDRLANSSDPERDRLLGLLLREARDVDVWKFTTPHEVVSRWEGIERHLGRRRAFWTLLLKKWQEEGLLAR